MLTLTLGVITGLLLGLTGAGGSVVALPLLMTGLQWPLTQAAPVALLAVCASATAGTITAWPQKLVRYRAALLMAFAGLFTAPLGLHVATLIPEIVLVPVFVIIIAVVALRMFLQAQRTPDETLVVRADLHGTAVAQRDVPCQVNADGRLRWTPPCMLAITASGAVSGFLSGLLGVGGGFVIVPVLRAVTALPMHGAVATSLMTIALTSAYTLGVTLFSGHGFPLQIAFMFVVGALIGMLLGRYLAPRLAGPTLQKGFAIFLLLSGSVLLAKTLFGLAPIDALTR